MGGITMNNTEMKKMMSDVLVEMDQYRELLQFNNFFGKTPREIIEIFGTYGGMIYSREEYLWRLSYPLSAKYSFREESRYSAETNDYVGAYHMAPAIDEDSYVDNYRRLSKIQEGEPVNGFFKLDEELDVTHSSL